MLELVLVFGLDFAAAVTGRGPRSSERHTRAVRPRFGSSHTVVPKPYRPAPRKSTAVTTELNIPARPCIKATAGPATMSLLMVPKLRQNLDEFRSRLVSPPRSQPEHSREPLGEDSHYEDIWVTASIRCRGHVPCPDCGTLSYRSQDQT